MKLLEFNNLIQMLGWMLLHSLWQGLLVYLLFAISQRVFRSASSTIKYAIGILSLSLMVTSCVITFLLQLDPVVVTVSDNQILNSSAALASFSIQEINAPEVGITVLIWINSHLQEIVMAWMIGTLIFGCRLLLAGWYAVRLRRNAEPITGFWESRLQEFAIGMGINRSVTLAQSETVASPILVGYLKPIILLPLGILSSLSPEQVEAVLLHELAHIKRADYAVNFIQSLMEVIFFFNPFVWAISAHVRMCREMCCDDTVIKWISPSTYAQALYKLEESQWPSASLALAASGNKNQLLQRIKRIMEPMRIRKESGGKVVPALMIIALSLVSGLFVGAYMPPPIDPIAAVDIASDTTKKDLELKKSTAPADSVSPETADVVLLEEMPVIELAEVDEPTVPDFPDLALDFPNLELAPVLAQIDLLQLDSIRGWAVPFETMDTLPVITWQNQAEWEALQKEFTEKFQQRFSDFYKKNQPEFEKMMKELELKMEKMHGTDHPWTARYDRQAEREMARANLELQRLLPRQQDRLKQQEFAARDMQYGFARKNLELAQQMKRLERHSERVGSGMKSFEKELTAELTKDGYMGKDDTIKNLNWEEDGTITINGKKIKDSDKAKYKQLHQKYFRERGRFRVDE